MTNWKIENKTRLSFPSGVRTVVIFGTIVWLANQLLSVNDTEWKISITIIVFVKNKRSINLNLNTGLLDNHENVPIFKMNK